MDVWPPPGVPRAQADSALDHAVASRRQEMEARSLESAGQGAMAVAAYRKAVMLNPGDIAIRRNLARHHVRMGVQLAVTRDWSAAWDNFNEAVRVDSTCADAWGNLGLLAQSSGQPEAALQATERARALDPKNESFVWQEGDFFRSERRWAEAITAYRAALDIRSDEPHALIGLAHCLARTGERKDARTTLDHAKRAGAPLKDVTLVEQLLAAPR
jgi:tetratricopeptide (TPR) repeat protein